MALAYLRRFGKEPQYPSDTHRAAAESVVDFCAADSSTQAVLLVGSCARGVASPESCVDITVLVAPGDLSVNGTNVLARFEDFVARDPACVALSEAVPWSGIDLDVCTGLFEPPTHSWTSGPDAYELEIGNTLAWVHPMLLRGDRFECLQDAYLPYYDDAQRRCRLEMVLTFAHNSLDHVVPYARRGLHFQAFTRLWHATGEYLQALFIQRRIYPIAYDKWIREQLVEVLDAPRLYEELSGLFPPASLDRVGLGESALRLASLINALC